MADLVFKPENIEQWPVDRPKLYAANARIHRPEQVERIAGSLAEYGWTVPILVDGNDEVIAGHGRLMAAGLLGLDTIPVIRLEHLTERQARAYRIADNKLTDLSTFDEDVLAGEFAWLAEAGADLPLTGFDQADVDKLLARLVEPEPLSEFQSYDETIPTEHRCPKCGYEWSGKTK